MKDGGNRYFRLKVVVAAKLVALVGNYFALLADGTEEDMRICYFLVNRILPPWLLEGVAEFPAALAV
jgi:hypothetical protein